MTHLKIAVELDGEIIGCYEFNLKDSALTPTKTGCGPIRIDFEPIADVPHQLIIDSLPPGRSKTIRGSDSAVTASFDPCDC